MALIGGSYRAGHDRHLPVGQGPGPLQFVGDEQHRPSLSGAAPQQPVEEVAAGGVEAGMGFVEQQEPGTAGQRHGQASPALLAGRKAAEGHAGQPGEAELLQDGVGVGRAAAAGPDPEAHVLPHGQVVVGARGVADEGQLGAEGAPVDCEVVTEHDGACRRPAAGGRPGGAGASSCRRRWGPATSTTSPSATSKSTPASAGYRPSRQTAERRWTADGLRFVSIGRGACRVAATQCTEDDPYPWVVDRLRSALSALGALLTAAGVLILLFVAYQLWGTGLYTSRQQGRLESQFKAQLEASATTSTTVNPANLPPGPPTGEFVAHIRIPKLGIDQYVVQGVGLADLRKGPGHYPETPLPGEKGNAAIAGHRTTYGAPFNRLGELVDGDELLVTSLKGSFTYKVARVHVVKPSQVEVLNPTSTPTLTLTTCHPKYSAKERLIVVADLAPGQTVTAATPPPAPAPGEKEQALPGDGLGGDAGLASDRSKVSTIAWGVFTAAIGLGWWLTIRRRRHWLSYAGGVLPFFVSLFFFYAHLELLLPANF